MIHSVLAIKLTALPSQMTASTPENQIIQSLVGIENVDSASFRL